MVTGLIAASAIGGFTLTASAHQSSAPHSGHAVRAHMAMHGVSVPQPSATPVTPASAGTAPIVTPTATATPAATPSASTTPTATPSATVTPTPTVTVTPTPAATGSAIPA